MEVFLDPVDGSIPVVGSYPTDASLVPVAAKDVRPSSQDPIPSPVPDLAALPSLGGGLSSLVPPRENALLSAPASLGLLSVSSEAWLGEVARVEDGWIAVKRKKSKPSVPPLDMNLKSCKGGSKSKIQ